MKYAHAGDMINGPFQCHQKTRALAQFVLGNATLDGIADFFDWEIKTAHGQVRAIQYHWAKRKHYRGYDGLLRFEFRRRTPSQACRARVVSHPTGEPFT